MVDFSRLIRQAEEAKGRPPRAKRAGAARKPRRKAAEPAPPAKPVAVEPPIAEPIPVQARPPVPPPEAILESLIPTDPVAPAARTEPSVEEPPNVRPAAPPPPEALAEAEIPTDPFSPSAAPEPAEELPMPSARRPAPPEAIAEAEIPPDAARPAPPLVPPPVVPPSPSGTWGTIEDLARMAQDEADEGPEETATSFDGAAAPASEGKPEPEADELAPAQVEPRDSAPPEAPIEEPVEAGWEEPVDREPPPCESAARAELLAPDPTPTEVAWEAEPPPAPVEDGLTPVQRTLVDEVKALLESLPREAAPLAGPAAAAEVLEEPRPEEPAPVPAPLEEVPQGPVEEVPQGPVEQVPQGQETVAEPDLSPEQERLIAEVKAILVDLGDPPRREEEPVAAPEGRIEDVPTSLPGTEAVDLPVEEASLPPPAPGIYDAGDLGEILGIVREGGSDPMAELDERARLAEALSPSPPLPEGLTEPARPAEEWPSAEAPSPEASEAPAPSFADAAAPASEGKPELSAPLEEPPPVPPPPVEEAAPPREELMPFPPPMEEPPPPEEERPRRRAPFDPFSDLRRRGKDLLDVGILLVGLAWLAGGLYTGDPISWVVALALVAVPSVDLYRRTTSRRSEPS